MKSGKSQAETPAKTMEGTTDDGRPTGEERKEGDEDSGDEVQIASGPQAKDCCASGTCQIF